MTTRTRPRPWGRSISQGSPLSSRAGIDAGAAVEAARRLDEAVGQDRGVGQGGGWPVVALPEPAHDGALEGGRRGPGEGRPGCPRPGSETAQPAGEPVLACQECPVGTVPEDDHQAAARADEPVQVAGGAVRECIDVAEDHDLEPGKAQLGDATDGHDGGTERRFRCRTGRPCLPRRERQGGVEEVGRSAQGLGARRAVDQEHVEAIDDRDDVGDLIIGRVGVVIVDNPGAELVDSGDGDGCLERHGDLAAGGHGADGPGRARDPAVDQELDAAVEWAAAGVVQGRRHRERLARREERAGQGERAERPVGLVAVRGSRGNGEVEGREPRRESKLSVQVAQEVPSRGLVGAPGQPLVVGQEEDLAPGLRPSLEDPERIRQRQCQVARSPPRFDSGQRVREDFPVGRGGIDQRQARAPAWSKATAWPGSRPRT